MNRYKGYQWHLLATALWADTDCNWREALDPTSCAGKLTASASDALYLALKLLGTKGIVAIPAYTCARVPAAVESAGWSTYLVDIDLATGGFSLESLHTALNMGCKAILLTHLFGRGTNEAEVIALAREFDAPVIEDSALYIHPGANVKSTLKIYSFGRGKPLSLGGGGALTWRNPAFADLLEELTQTLTENQPWGILDLLRASIRDSNFALWLARHKQRPRSTYSATLPAYSYRPISPRNQRYLAWTLSRQHLEEQDAQNLSRKPLDQLTKLLKESQVEIIGEPGFRIPAGAYVPALAMRSTQRDQLVKRLRKVGMDVPLYWQSSLSRLAKSGASPGANTLADEIFFLPTYRTYHPDEIQRLMSALNGHRLVAFS
ncbi:MAG: hypothetical protein EVA65_08875 [Oceanococcus sp.]|nr:MAG: hypothetical protein EVA65_08875 [Oceanococcus sp.]